VKIPFNYKEVVKGRHPEQNIPLKPGDTIVVP
jgi:polysaccharide biosynthesis/export protein